MTALKAVAFTIGFLLLCVLGAVVVPIGVVLLMLAGFALLGLFFVAVVWNVALKIFNVGEP